MNPFQWISRPPIPSYGSKPVHDIIIKSRDQRNIGVCVWGYPDPSTAKCVIIYFHGCPGSRFETPWLCDETSHEYHIKHEITLITIDRPGYGASHALSRNQYRTFTDMSNDVFDILQHLHVDLTRTTPHIALIGFSSGAHQVHACMISSWKQHIACSVLVAGQGPFSEYPSHIQQLIARSNPMLYYAKYLYQYGLDYLLIPAYRIQQYMFIRNPKRFLQNMYGYKMMLSPLIATQLQRSMYAVFVEGQPYSAVWHDLCVPFRGYGCQLEDIEGRYCIFQGERDKIRPPDETRYIESRLKSATVTSHYLPQDNHILHWRPSNWHSIVSSIMHEIPN